MKTAIVLANAVASSANQNTSSHIIVEWSESALLNSILQHRGSAGDSLVSSSLTSLRDSMSTREGLDNAIKRIFNGQIVSNISVETLPMLPALTQSMQIKSIRRMNALGLDFIEVNSESAADLVTRLSMHPDVKAVALDSAVISPISPIVSNSSRDADAESATKENPEGKEEPVKFIPDDPLNTGLYGLKDHKMFEVWGSRVPEGGNKPTPFPKPVVVAVHDTSLDFRHFDLEGGIWTNEGEIPDNGIDDDGNGYVDDYHGFDVLELTGSTLPDGGSHGTHCSGLVAATADNGSGISGFASFGAAKVMGVRFSGRDAQDRSAVVRALEALNYSYAMGADVTSNSWAIDPEFQTESEKPLYEMLKNAFARTANSTIHFFAAGNEEESLDTYKAFPSSWAADLPNALTVCATDKRGLPANFSNYSPELVHVCTAGVEIPSTVPGGVWDWKSGTSMATPTAAGIAATVMASLKEAGLELSPSELRDVLVHPEATHLNVEKFSGTNIAKGYMDGYGALQLALKVAAAKKEAREMKAEAVLERI